MSPIGSIRASVRGSVTDVPDIDNIALEFDGVDDIVSFGTPSIFGLNDVETGTIEIWVKFLSDPEDRQAIWGDQDDPVWGLMAEDESIRWFRISSNDNAVLSDFTPSVGEWVHVSISFEDFGSTADMFINGEFDSRLEGSGPIDRSIDDINLGEYAGSYGNVVLSEARLWEHPRTEAEIQSDYERPLNGDEDGLIGYWPIKEGEGSTAFDKVGSVDGDIIGPVWVEDGP